MKISMGKIFVFVAVLVSGYSYAWGLTGHRVIAEIAQNHLSCRAKHQIKKLLGKEKLAYWANWPDFIKSDSTEVWKKASAWHYVNAEPQKNIGEFSSVIKTQTNENLYNQIELLAGKLKNKNLAKDERKTALVFLIHLLGDLSQPLHAGREGDLGGNKIEVTYFGEKTNLHSVWDGKLIDSQKYSYMEYAQLLDTKNRQENKAIQQGSLMDWLYDSQKEANHIYYQTPAGSQLGFNYQYKFNAVLERQLLYGGLRLAKYLNEIFK